jgi:hypothetical protein
MCNIFANIEAIATIEPCHEFVLGTVSVTAMNKITYSTKIDIDMV